MALAPGRRLGPYQIVAPLGAGGMGEVYKAHDTRLDRIVAIKTLPTALADDPQFRERFDREARTVSQLDHPHICAVYDVGQQDAVAYLVMQYLEGETLETRLKKGALPLDQALQYAIQIADALDKAHRAGIVHRDLKPGNIMLTKAGAKLLDFGLAKRRPAGAVAGMSAAATISGPLTGQGTVLGTLHYMSPEQLEGKEADARSDIFSLGALVHEMATGRRAFEGQSAASIMAAILQREAPAVSSLQPLTPPALDHVVGHCLVKDPDGRWQSAADIVHELRWTLEAGSSAPVAGTAPPARRPWIWMAATMISLIAAAAILVVHVRERPPSPRVLRYSISLPRQGQSEGLYFNFHLSPDGRFAAVSGVLSGKAGIFLRELAASDFRFLTGTDTGDFFWSADSRSIAFFEMRKLKKIDIGGGPAEVICDLVGLLFTGTGSWSNSDAILFSPPTGGPLLLVSATGGEPRPGTAAGKGIDHLYPEFLPDGRHFLYTQRGLNPGIYVASLDGAAGRRLLTDESSANFVPATSAGEYAHLIFVRDGKLMAQRFDPKALQLQGDAFVLLERALWNTSLSAAVSVSDGILVYLDGRNREVDSRLVWFDRSGKAIGAEGTTGAPAQASVSPDGKTAAIFRRIPGGVQGGDLWLRDLSRAIDTKFTYGGAVDPVGNPVWSPEGNRIVFSADLSKSFTPFRTKTDLYVKDLSAPAQAEPLVQNENHKIPTDWSRAGLLLFTEAAQKTGADLWYIPIDANSQRNRKPVPFLQTEFDESFGQLSPDGRWIAYLSNESGAYEIYVRPFPSGTGKWKVSSSTGTGTGTQQPRWNPNGRELFYLTGPVGTLTLMAVPVTPGRSGPGATPTFEIGAPRPLFDVRANAYHPAFGTFFYTVSRDGQRFLINHVESAAEPVLNVVVNWEQAFSGK